MVFTTDALVLRSSDVGDYDRLMILLAPELGRISVLAKGVRSPRNKFAAATLPYVFGGYEIYRKGELNWLRGGVVNEYFKGLREDIEKLSLAAYIADVANELSGENLTAVDILRMTLNTYYALDKDIKRADEIKAVYEWRAAGFAGYMPDLTSCGLCGCKESEAFYLDVMNGRLICRLCLGKTPRHVAPDGEDIPERSILIPMGAGALAAARFSLAALPERMFSFRIKDDDERHGFCRAAETYLLNHIERGFDSLEFYRTIIK